MIQFQFHIYDHAFPIKLCSSEEVEKRKLLQEIKAKVAEECRCKRDHTHNGKRRQEFFRQTGNADGSKRDGKSFGGKRDGKSFERGGKPFNKNRKNHRYDEED
jgi:hypothetical protein